MYPEEGQVIYDEQIDPNCYNVSSQKSKQASKKTRSARKKSKRFTMTSSNYRKEKCEYYNKNACKKGDLCTFSHDFYPSISKKICRYFIAGACSKGESCSYSHNTHEYPCRYFHIENRCLNLNCRFSHEPISPDLAKDFILENKDLILMIHYNGEPVQEMFKEYIEELQQKPKIITFEKQETKNLYTKIEKKDPRQRIKVIDLIPETKILTLKTVKNPINIGTKEEINSIFIENLQKYFDSYY